VSEWVSEWVSDGMRPNSKVIQQPEKKSVRTAPNTTPMTWRLLTALRAEVGKAGVDGRQGDPGVGPQVAGARAQAGAQAGAGTGANQPAMLLNQQQMQTC